jgi:outer membrane lipoprotein-sorting protein
MHKTASSKTILWALLLLFSVHGYAQDARTVVQRFLEKMTAGTVEMSFKLTYDNAPKKIHDMQTGTLTYSGEQYRLQSGDLDVYCDGLNKWIYNKSVDEVTIFPAEETDGITGNPLKYIMANEANFRYRPLKRLSQNGRKLLSAELIPASKDAPYTMINLQVDEATFLPVQLTCKTKDGQRHIIDVDTIDTEAKVKAFGFTFPAHRYPGAVVNDLR